MPPLSPGRIFWAVYPGHRGDGKTRPMIVASRRADIVRTRQVLAVVCSSDFSLPTRPDEVLLPSDEAGRCSTRLRRPTVAVCDWTTALLVSQIEEVGGLVPNDLLREICAKAGIVIVPDW